MYKCVLICVYICRRIPPRAGEGQAAVGGGSAQSMPCFTIRLRAKQKGGVRSIEPGGGVRKNHLAEL